MFIEMMDSSKFVCTVVCLISIFNLTVSDYCGIMTCSNPERHVMCLYPEDKRGDNCRTTIESDEAFMSLEMLKTAHETVRTAMGKTFNVTLAELEWDDELATLAQRWSNQCSDQKDECRSLEKYKYPVQQNVAVQEYSVALFKERSPIAILIQITTGWSSQKNNPLNPTIEVYQGMNRFGCAVTKSSRYTSSVLLYPVDQSFAYITCNYAKA